MLHRKVLIADDDPVMRRLVAHWLETAGYEVQQVSDGFAALEAAHRDCPHFLITDWDMPGLNGIDLCGRVREEGFPHYIYTVLLTAHNKVNDIILALETGADDLLAKPVAAPELLARLSAGARVIELENQLVLLARTDPLTGVPNRWVFFEQFERELARAKRYDLPLSCVLCDIDFFKTVNDNHGHIVGDMILRAFAQVISAQCRSTDHLCRYGGEEFCVLLTDTDEASSASWAERIRVALRAMALPEHATPLTITASFGCAALSDDVDTPQALLDRADRALQAAKHSGRDRAVHFGQLHIADGMLSTPMTGHRDLLLPVVARDVMTAPAVCLHESQAIGEAARLLLQMQISSAPVIGDEGKLVGIVSEKDILTAPVQPEGWRVPLREIMKTNVVCYDEETPAVVIFDFLCRVTIRRVVIVREGVPTGVVSRGALLAWLEARLLENAPELAAYDSVTLPRDVATMRQSTAALAAQSLALLGAIEHPAQAPSLVAHVTAIQKQAGKILALSHALTQRAPGAPTGGFPTGPIVASDSCPV